MDNIKCEICGRDFKSMKGFSRHILKGHKIKTEEYYLKYINPEKGKCLKCGNDTTFIDLSNGYREYCSIKCSCHSEKVKNKSKETCVKKYGCENPMQNKEIKNKHKETCNKNFGSDHPLQNKEIQNKHKKTCIERFGCEYPTQNKEVMDKSKESCMKNFGYENPSKCPEIKNKQKETCFKNHGVEHPGQIEEAKIKYKETCMKKFGFDNANKSEEIKNKKKITCKKNFGCEYPSQNIKIMNKMRESIKLNFIKVQKRYPDLVTCEELIPGPNGEILGHCKNSNCKNSKENSGYFELTTYQIIFRNRGINSVKDGNYLYCCEECKNECPLFGRSALELHNFLNEDFNIPYTTQEYLIWKNEILSRQLIENKDHLENYCEICHSTENLQVHHEIPKKLEPFFSLDPDNGIILCQKCHLEKGHKKGTLCSTGNLANKLC